MLESPFARRRAVAVAVAAVLLPACLVHPPRVYSQAEAADPLPSAGVAVAEIGMTVSDLDRAVTFFTDVLTFERVGEAKRSGDAFSRLQGLESADARTARLKLGDESIELTEYTAPAGRPFPTDSRSNDLWFQHIAIIVSDMDLAYARLREHGVRPASVNGPQRLPDWNPNAAGIRAFYFRDPDGHFLEILEFPPGKGDPKWHVGTGRLFLGIDHTAIVVADTDASLRFYRDSLGFRVVGGSENYGVEQEALNNVPGAHLRITTLRGHAGPAIEILEYLQPRDGRPLPPDARSNDIFHWQTTLIVAAPETVAERLRRTGARFVSPDVIELQPSQSAGGEAVIVRDPDGHAMKIAEE